MQHQFYRGIATDCFLTDSDMSSVKVITLGVFDSAIKWRSQYIAMNQLSHYTAWSYQ